MAEGNGGSPAEFNLKNVGGNPQRFLLLSGRTNKVPFRGSLPRCPIGQGERTPHTHRRRKKHQGARKKNSKKGALKRVKNETAIFPQRHKNAMMVLQRNARFFKAKVVKFCPVIHYKVFLVWKSQVESLLLPPGELASPASPPCRSQGRKA